MRVTQSHYSLNNLLVIPHVYFYHCFLYMAQYSSFAYDDPQIGEDDADSDDSFYEASAIPSNPQNAIKCIFYKNGDTVTTVRAAKTPCVSILARVLLHILLWSMCEIETHWVVIFLRHRHSGLALRTHLRRGSFV